jgi:hypothetical protein
MTRRDFDTAIGDALVFPTHRPRRNCLDRQPTAIAAALIAAGVFLFFIS